MSSSFHVKNGVRQGGVCSAILFAIYIDDLIQNLRSSNIGCSIFGEYCGVFVFADDIVLLSASRNGLQTMVDICQEFVGAKNLKFGTDLNHVKSKTKCIIFGKKSPTPVKNISLNGNILPWVNEIKHLGNTLQANNSMGLDINLKRGAFIGRVNSILQEFHFASPEVLMKCIKCYATSFSGCQLWSLSTNESEKLYQS